MQKIGSKNGQNVNVKTYRKCLPGQSGGRKKWVKNWWKLVGEGIENVIEKIREKEVLKNGWKSSLKMRRKDAEIAVGKISEKSDRKM